MIITGKTFIPIKARYTKRATANPITISNNNGLSPPACITFLGQ